MEDKRPWFEGKTNLSYNLQIDRWLSAVDKLSKSIEELKLAKKRFEQKVSKLKSVKKTGGKPEVKEEDKLSKKKTEKKSKENEGKDASEKKSKKKDSFKPSKNDAPEKNKDETKE